MLHLHPNRAVRAVLTALICLMLATGINACGKRGDPYKPSEISSST